METQNGFLPVEGGALYYEVTGQGHPLMMVHAGVADLRMWDDQVAAFADRYRLIRYDTRGFGRTTSANVSFSNRQDILDLLNHLGIAKTAIMGLSHGGSIVLDFTLEHPDRVDALIVVAGGVSGFDTDSTAVEMAQLEPMEAAEERKDFAALTEMEVRYWVDGPGQPEGRSEAAVRDRVRSMITNNYQNHAEEPQPRVLEPPAAGRLGEVRVPTLVIIGGLDESATNAGMELVAAGIQGARKVVFPDTAHMVNLEQPALFNQVIGDFLADALK